MWISKPFICFPSTKPLKKFGIFFIIENLLKIQLLDQLFEYFFGLYDPLFHSFLKYYYFLLKNLFKELRLRSNIIHKVVFICNKCKLSIKLHLFSTFEYFISLVWYKKKLIFLQTPQFFAKKLRALIFNSISSILYKSVIKVFSFKKK